MNKFEVGVILLMTLGVIGIFRVCEHLTKITRHLSNVADRLNEIRIAAEKIRPR